MAERLRRGPRDKETLEDYLMYLRHVAAYRFARKNFFCNRIIDLGCGTGYGTKLLTNNAKMVIGIDRVYEVEYDNSKSSRIWFVVGDIGHLPFKTGTFDLGVSFQVIEHIPYPLRYVKEAHRVLAIGGKLLITTPNRKLRLLPTEHPWNPYHIIEYRSRTLKSLLKKKFFKVQIFGLAAISDIERLERRRLKLIRVGVLRRKVLFVLNELPFGLGVIAMIKWLKRMLLYRVIAPPKDKSKSMNIIDQEFYQKYSINDFWITEESIDKRMDLVAVCKK